MPSSRERGGTRIPRSGEDTTRPAMVVSPDVGCSRPATQRKVVVLPQPDGPSRTTISPDGTEKLTPSTAGRPIANCLRRSVTSSVAVMNEPSSCAERSLPIPEGLVPVRDPGCVQLHVLIELGVPDLDHLGIEAFGIGRRLLQRSQIAYRLYHEYLGTNPQPPLQEQSCLFRMCRGLSNSR